MATFLLPFLIIIEFFPGGGWCVLLAGLSYVDHESLNYIGLYHALLFQLIVRSQHFGFPHVFGLQLFVKIHHLLPQFINEFYLLVIRLLRNEILDLFLDWSVVSSHLGVVEIWLIGLIQNQVFICGSSCPANHHRVIISHIQILRSHRQHG